MVLLVRYFKQVNGLSYDRLSKLMGRDPEQLMDWLSGRKKSHCNNIQSIVIFLAKEGV